jgi:hypothetical protein
VSDPCSSDEPTPEQLEVIEAMHDYELALFYLMPAPDQA